MKFVFSQSAFEVYPPADKAVHSSESTLDFVLIISRSLLWFLTIQFSNQLLQRILFDAIICRIRKIKTSHF